MEGVGGQSHSAALLLLLLLSMAPLHRINWDKCFSTTPEEQRKKKKKKKTPLKLANSWTEN